LATTYGWMTGTYSTKMALRSPPCALRQAQSSAVRHQEHVPKTAPESRRSLPCCAISSAPPSDGTSAMALGLA
jgi:hypothetical protein